MPRDFNGTTAFLNGGDITALNSLTEMSFHLWAFIDHFNPAAGGSDQMLWQKCDSGFNGISVWLDDDGPNADLVYEMYNSASERVQHNTYNLITGEWFSIGGYIDWTGVNPSVLYVNGAAAGSVTITTNNMSGQNLLLGVHQATGGARWLAGKLAHLSIWNDERSAANFVSLAAGADPETIGTPLLYWKIAGDSSPEPEEITGTDTLTVTVATKSAVPVLSSVTIDSTVDNTLTISGISDQKGGDMKCYVSASATPPSVADLIAGTGAVASGTLTKPSAIRRFTGAAEAAQNVNAYQGVVTDGTWYFTTGGTTGAPDNQRAIHVYNSSWVEQSSFDCGTLGLTGLSQVCDMHVVGSSLYVVGNNWSTTPRKGYYMQFSINPSTGALTHTTSAELSQANWAEGVSQYNGEWFVCYHNGHGIDRYNSSWVFQENHALPVGTDPGGTQYWQGMFWIDDVMYINLHNGNAAAPAIHAYHYYGGDFYEHNTEILKYTENGLSLIGGAAESNGQGFFLESDGQAILWAARQGDFTGDVWRSTGIETGGGLGVMNGSITGIPAGDYYLHSVADHTLSSNEPWTSAIATSSQFTITGSSAKKHAPKVIHRGGFPRRIKMGIR